LVRENGEEFASRKDAKDAKFGKIKVWAAKKNGWVAGPLRAWRLGGRKNPETSSRKGANLAKFGERIRSDLLQSQK
jgi:hypothetical protein